MKIAVVNDNHFGCRGDNPIFRTMIEKFFSEQFFPYLDEHNITTIINAGDIFDRRKFINFQTLGSFQKHFINPVLERDITLHNILGNHDVFLKNTNTINSVEQVFSYIESDKIYTYRNPQEIWIDDREILVLPWITRDNYKDSIRALETSKAEIAIGHLEIAGFEMEVGHMMETGLSSSLFSRFKKVYSGHYHHKSDDGKIFYFGTQYQLHWSDYDQKKGFHILDTDTLEVEYIVNDDQMFYKLVYDDKENGSDHYRDMDVSHLHQKAIKMNVISREDPYCFEKFIERINSTEPFSFSMVESVDDEELDDGEPISVEDTLTLLYDCVDTLKDTNNKENKDALKKLLHELYNEALTLT